jgi:hypothetical protein
LDYRPPHYGRLSRHQRGGGAAISNCLYAFIIYRIILRRMQIEEGELRERPRGEFIAQVNTIFT